MFGISLVTILSVVIFVLIVILIGLIYYVYKFATKLLLVVDIMEASLDILDERYGSISKILETPLFYDSPEIRQVLADVEVCRDAILQIANMLGNIEIIEEN